MNDIISRLEDAYFTRGGEYIRDAIREIENRNKRIAALECKVLLLETRATLAKEVKPEWTKVTLILSEPQILKTLELISRDTVIASGESEYIPIGEIVHRAAEHIKFLREQIKDLEAWRFGG